MGALFDDPPVLHDKDAVGLQHGGEAMRDDQRGAALHEMVKCFLHQLFAGRIERRGRLVEKQDRRVAQDGTGDRDALALTARQHHAALAELRVVALGQPANELVGERRLRCRLDLAV